MTETAAPLAGLSVAVTRPARQGDTLIRLLQEQGADVAAIPLLAITPLAEPAAQSRIDVCLQSLSGCNIAIFISQNAAEQLLLALAARKLHWPDNITAFAVGSATADYLNGCGIAAASPARMDSEGLLALPALQHVTGKRCVVFRGKGGRETLAQALRARGATVDYCELYQRTLPDNAGTAWTQWISERQQPVLACINSTETLRNLLLVDQGAVARDNLTLVVPGERVTRHAQDAGFSRLCTATDATDPSIFHTITHWYLS